MIKYHKSTKIKYNRKYKKKTLIHFKEEVNVGVSFNICADPWKRFEYVKTGTKSREMQATEKSQKENTVNTLEYMGKDKDGENI